MGRLVRVMAASAWLALQVGWGGVAHAADGSAGSRPEVRSAAAMVVDAQTGQVLFERQAAHVAPIASITKLMTALVVLDAGQPLDEAVEITAADRWRGKGAFSRLPVGARLTRADLLRLALLASENRAAVTLARVYPGGTARFVRAMNAKARALGMTHTRFDDPSGLSSLNVSNARDLVKLVVAAARNPLISEFSTLPSHEVRVSRKSTLVYRNTNLLVGKPDWAIDVQKTGFTNDAGECLVMQTVLEERPVVMVLLNSFGTLTRTADARRIRRWMEGQRAPVFAGGGELAKK
jgi:serine-type D-Ala-D-Ala endopeptidase (penicillin-binding protein 7)